MKTILSIIHIIISVLLVVLILLQTEGSGLGSTFGGSGAHFHSKRGAERIVFSLTIFLAAAFFLSSIATFLSF